MYFFKKLHVLFSKSCKNKKVHVLFCKVHFLLGKTVFEIIYKNQWSHAFATDTLVQIPPPLPNDHFENFLIRCISSNCPRPLRAIKHIAHALIYVLNSPFSTWYIECMPQSHGHHQARYNLCHIPTPRKSSGSWTLVFQIPSACKYCSKMPRNPPARCCLRTNYSGIFR